MTEVNPALGVASQDAYYLVKAAATWPDVLEAVKRGDVFATRSALDAHGIHAAIRNLGTVDGKPADLVLDAGVMGNALKCVTQPGYVDLVFPPDRAVGVGQFDTAQRTDGSVLFALPGPNSPDADKTNPYGQAYVPGTPDLPDDGGDTPSIGTPREVAIGKLKGALRTHLPAILLVAIPLLALLAIGIASMRGGAK